MESRPSQVVSGLVDGISVLQQLATSIEPVSGLSLARRMDMDPVRINRLLKTLAWMGIAHRDKSRRYSIGPGMHILATLNLGVSGHFRQIARQIQPLLKYPYTVASGVLWQDMVSYLYCRSPGQEAMEGIYHIVRPASNSSIGMALLAHLPDSQIDAMYDQRIEPIPGPFANLDEFKKGIEETRRLGYAALRFPTHVSLAMAVGQPPYAAIAISGFKTSDEEALFVELLTQIADRIADGPTASDTLEHEGTHSLEHRLQRTAPSALA